MSKCPQCDQWIPPPEVCARCGKTEKDESLFGIRYQHTGEPVILCYPCFEKAETRLARSQDKFDGWLAKYIRRGVRGGPT